ncbi:hypothetical protein Sjap_007511 [Stephania japonica]|uniref:Uncharacterized protein n=1 Tax=Stephania japonica TaxID=461633 RepID=A0AAP0JMV4_9MAGN
MYRKRRASTLEIPLKIAMVENVSPSRIDITDGNEPLSNTNVHLQDDEEMVIVEANLEEHIEAPLIINAEEIKKSPDIALDIQKIIEEIKERPSGVDVRRWYRTTTNNV